MHARDRAGDKAEQAGCVGRRSNAATRTDGGSSHSESLTWLLNGAYKTKEENLKLSDFCRKIDRNL